jgi:hypothetical protein
MPMCGTCIDYDSIDHLCGISGIHCGQEKPACHGGTPIPDSNEKMQLSLQVVLTESLEDYRTRIF